MDPAFTTCISTNNCSIFFCPFIYFGPMFPSPNHVVCHLFPVRSNSPLCRCYRRCWPFDGGVVLVQEVSSQGKELLWGSDLVWFAGVLVGHHHGADAHVLGADRHLKRQTTWQMTEALSACCSLLSARWWWRMVQLCANVSANIHVYFPERSNTDRRYGVGSLCAQHRSVTVRVLLQHVSVSASVSVLWLNANWERHGILFIYKRQRDPITFLLYSFQINRLSLGSAWYETDLLKLYFMQMESFKRKEKHFQSNFLKLFLAPLLTES